MKGPQASLLPDGRRLHLNHGPIDLIIEAFGSVDEVRQAYGQAVARFQTILGELVEELTELRRPASAKERRFFGPTARRMEAAVAPLAGVFITPMAAVAGAVADEMMAAMTKGRRLEKAYVNNGGDVALHVPYGQSLTVAIGGTGHGFSDRIGISGLPAADTIDSDTATPLGERGQAGGVNHDCKAIGGIATSGWRGRSFSLGIADAVTVLARTAAGADAAATIIANAVDLPGHPAVTRQPACALSPDSDLGVRLVTTGVGTLSAFEVAGALEAGRRAADDLVHAGLIAGAALSLAGESRVVGNPFSQRLVNQPIGRSGHVLRPRANLSGSIHA